METVLMVKNKVINKKEAKLLQLAPDIGNGNFLVGEFTHEKTKERYVLIVNRCLERSNTAIISWRKIPGYDEPRRVGNMWQWLQDEQSF